MKFSGVFVVAEVWLTAKIQFFSSGLSKFATDKFSSLSVFHQNVVTFTKRILRVFTYSKLKGGLLDFLDSFTEVY
jgi:hypothetical protein